MKTRQILAVVLCAFAVETAWAHFPVEVRTSSEDGLVRLGWTPLQVGVFPVYPLQAVSGDADVYGIAVSVLTLRQNSAIVSASLENGIKANYLADGRRIDQTIDEGDDGCFQRKWSHAWNEALRIRKKGGK